MESKFAGGGLKVQNPKPKVQGKSKIAAQRPHVRGEVEFHPGRLFPASDQGLGVDGVHPDIAGDAGWYRAVGAVRSAA
jgi:hypothetical protein